MSYHILKILNNLLILRWHRVVQGHREDASKYQIHIITQGMSEHDLGIHVHIFNMYDKIFG